jgi:hypothetical protein
MDVTINNQCTDIELTSTAYFTKDATCHIQFPLQVNTNRIMKASFITGINRDTFGGALLYHLRQKEDASIITQLLVIWGYKSDGLYSYVLPIEHKNTLVWNEDKLKRLYNIYDSQCNVSSNIERWLLNNNTNLKAECELSHGGFGMNIIVSEEKNRVHLTRPLCIDPNR